MWKNLRLEGCAILAETIINNNGIVYGVTYADDFKSAHYIRIETPDELDKIKGSKYIYADKKLNNGKFAYISAVDDLKEGKLVLFTGLGCDIAALEKTATLRNAPTENLYTVDLICHGPTFPAVQSSYICELEERAHSKVVDTMREISKKGGQHHVYMLFLQMGMKYRNLCTKQTLVSRSSTMQENPVTIANSKGLTILQILL